MGKKATNDEKRFNNRNNIAPNKRGKKAKLQNYEATTARGKKQNIS